MNGNEQNGTDLFVGSAAMQSKEGSVSDPTKRKITVPEKLRNSG